MNNFNIDETITYLLIQACKAHRNLGSKVLQEAGLFVGQDMVLKRLANCNGLTPTELSEAQCIQPATVTRMVNRLENEGFVEKRPDEQDQRSVRVYLTDKGWKAVDFIRGELWQNIEEKTTKNLTTEERLLLRRLLKQILDNLQAG